MPTAATPPAPIEAAATMPADRTGMDRRLISGIAWTSLSKWVFQAFTWATSIFIARLLSPADYGIAGMAWVYVGLVQMLGELGVGAALIQRGAVAEDTVRRLYGLTVVLGGALAALSVPAGIGLAAFYSEPRLQAVIAVYGLNFIASGLRALPNTLLTKDLDFRTIALVTVAEGAAASLTSLVLAAGGFGYWALVIGNTVAAWLGAMLLYWRRPVRLSWPRFHNSERSLLSFGANLTVGRFAWYLYSNSDFIVVGRLLGPVQLGYYTLAWQLAGIPIERLAGSVTQVLFPVLSAVKSDKGAANRYLDRLVEVLTLVIFPVTAGMALVGPFLIVGLLGDKWTQAVWPFCILALAGNSRLLTGILHQLLVSGGEVRFVARCSITACLVMPLAFVVASSYGLLYVAVAWLLLHPLVLLVPALVKAKHVCDVSVRALVAAAVPAAVGTAVMTLAVLTVTRYVAHTGAIQTLVLLVAVGAAAYLTTMFTVFRDHIQAIGSFLSIFRPSCRA